MTITPLSSRQFNSTRMPARPRKQRKRALYSSPIVTDQHTCCSRLTITKRSRTDVPISQTCWRCPAWKTLSLRYRNCARSRKRRIYPDVLARFQCRFRAAQGSPGKGGWPRSRLGRQHGCCRFVPIGNCHPGIGNRCIAGRTPRYIAGSTPSGRDERPCHPCLHWTHPGSRYRSCSA